METGTQTTTIRKDLIRLAILVVVIVVAITGLKIADQRTGVVKTMGNDLYKNLIRK